MSLPYFPMYPSDFEAKTSHLTLAEDGAYNRLLRIMWMTSGCTIPDDDAWIMRRLRCDKDTFDAVVRVVIDEYFDSDNGRLSNAKLSSIYTTTNEAHERRVNAGSKGGKAKALRSNDKVTSNAKAMAKQPEPEPEPIEVDTKVSLSSVDDDAVKAAKAQEIKTAVEAYNSAASFSGWPRVAILSPARKSALSARLRESGGLDGWYAAISKAQSSSHCCGQNDRGWVASFDFISKQSSFAKLMEGNYDDRKQQNKPSPNNQRGEATLDLIAQAARAR